MVEINKILVPTDFSENAAQAYPYACGMAKKFGATVTLVHVVEPFYLPITPGDFAAGWETLELRMSEVIDQSFAKALAHFEGVEARGLRRNGSPLEELVQAAKEEEADLIVIATHGHSGLQHVLLGSTAEKLVRGAPCPILTIRSEAS